MPNGRRKGEPFASGIAPVNGADRLGPTAVTNSMNRLDFSAFPNGINFNMRFQADLVRGERGRNALKSLLGVYFKRGGMQAQVNVLDAETLRKAKLHPELFPNLLVRVSGFSAYFNDLSEPVKDEIIARTEHMV
jgi:formate C-acetyltransferase